MTAEEKIRELLKQPLGSPVSLTRDEADEIVRNAAGRRPDFPNGKDYVNKVRGHRPNS